MKRMMIGLAGLLIAAAGPVIAQTMASNGEEFLKALREHEGSKALKLAQADGSSVINHRGQDGSTALHIVVHQGWEPIAPGCLPADGDTVLALQKP